MVRDYLRMFMKRFFCYELNKEDVYFERQAAIELIHENIRLDAGFRADVIIDKTLLIEFKSVEKLANVHFKQVQTYLKLSNLKLGLLINFNHVYLKEGIHRIANNL